MTERKNILPITAVTPNIKILPRSLKKDIPVISEYMDNEIVLKKDFVRLLASMQGSNTVNVYKVTFYFNFLLALFDIDEISVCLYDDRGKEKDIKTISIEEKLSPREQEIISYIRGVIKHARQMENFEVSYKTDLISSPRSSQTNLVEKTMLGILFNDSDPKYEQKEKWRVENIKEKFPEVFLVEGKMYLYSQSFYSTLSNPKKEKNRLPLPVSKDFLNILSRSKRSSNTENSMTRFQKSCFEAIDYMIDPMQIFIKSNFVKSPSSQKLFTPIDELSSRVISSFFNTAVPNSGLNVGIDELPTIPDSGLYLNTTLTNLKKISFEQQLDSREGFDISTIKIKLVKNRGKEKEIYRTIDCYEDYERSSRFFESQKMDNLGSFPVNYAFRSNPNEKIVTITREQLHDNTISSINCNRIVSKSEDLNSAFKQTNTNDGPSTDIVFDSNGTINLNREIIKNTRGEFKVLSRVIHSKKFYSNFPSLPKPEEKLSKINLISFCVSKDSDGSPTNIIKVQNLPPGVRVARVNCVPEINNSSFLIPIKFDSDEIVHGNPLPGVRYTYIISLNDDEGYFHKDILTTKQLTLPQAPANILLEDQGIYIDDDQNRLLKIGLSKNLLTNYANAISSTLDKIFQPAERDFYNEEFASKLRANLQNIGKNFELYVSYFAKDDGDYLDTYSIGISEQYSDDNDFVFLIPMDIALEDFTVQYNLIVTNPIDLINLEENVLDENSKKIFKRSTSKFFATITSLNGALPSLVKDQNNGNEFYKGSKRFSNNSKFERMVCSGGYTFVEKDPGYRRHRLFGASASCNPDDNEHNLYWNVARISPGFRKETYLEFFIITAVLEGLEVPLTAFPFIGYTKYHVRLDSMLGVNNNVKFKVYPVYHDYYIDLENVVETPYYNIEDFRMVGLREMP